MSSAVPARVPPPPISLVAVGCGPASALRPCLGGETLSFSPLPPATPPYLMARGRLSLIGYLTDHHKLAVRVRNKGTHHLSCPDRFILKAEREKKSFIWLRVMMHQGFGWAAWQTLYIEQTVSHAHYSLTHYCN